MGKTQSYIEFLKAAIYDEDIAEKFQCMAKVELANYLQKTQSSTKDIQDSLTLFAEVIHSQNARKADVLFAKATYKKVHDFYKNKFKQEVCLN